MSDRRVTRSGKGGGVPAPIQLTQAQINAGIAQPSGPCNWAEPALRAAAMPDTDTGGSATLPDERPKIFGDWVHKLKNKYLKVLGTDCVTLTGEGEDIQLTIYVPRTRCTVTVQWNQPTIKLVHPLGGHPITGDSGGSFTYIHGETIPACVYNDAVDLVDRCIEHGRKYGTRGLEELDRRV